METPVEISDVQTKPNRTIWLIGGGCLLVLCCCSVLAFLLWWQYGTQIMNLFGDQPPELPEQLATSVPAGTITKVEGNTLGNPDAPVTIIVYSDFQCQYCERYWRETEPQIIANYVETGQVYYIYRSLGAFIAPESQRSAKAAYCAGDQERFWEYHDLLFAHQAGENMGAFSDRNLMGFANSLGLDMDQFTECFDGGKYTGRVGQDRIDGQNSGVQGTPSFLINGRLVEGAQPYSNVAPIIDSELDK